MEFEVERTGLEGDLGRMEVEYGEKLRRRRIEVELDLLNEIQSEGSRGAGKGRIEELLGRVVEILRQCDLVTDEESANSQSVRSIRESRVDLVMWGKLNESRR